MMKDDQRGHIVVETATSFVLFVFFVVSILSMINVVVVQARVHYAVSQAAVAVSMYDYTLNAAGLDDEFVTIVKQADKFEQDVNTFQNNINTVMDTLTSLSKGDISGVDYSGTKEAGSAAYDQAAVWVDTTINNPEVMIRTLLGYGLTKGSQEAFGALIRPIVGRYLTNGSQSGDEYLRSMKVIDGLDGLEFTGTYDSIFLDGNGDVVITVHYAIDYDLGALPMPFTELQVTQTVKTKAWLGGAGEGYSKAREQGG